MHERTLRPMLVTSTDLARISYHPLADLFPLIDGAEFDELVADIAAYGVRELIVIYQDKILDGRNRARAAQAAGVEARLIEYDGDDPLAYVISLNLKRRNLDELQRAMVAARIATLRRGANQHSPIGESTSQARAAAVCNVGKRSVERARRVLDAGSPALVAACDQGRIAVSIAAKLAEKTDEQFQDAVVSLVTNGTGAMEAFRLVRAARTAEQDAIAPTGKYRVLYADPPWSYGNTQQPEFGEQRDHYATMTLDEICKLPVKEWAENDAVLFLWATSPILKEAFQVIEAWGFEYKASFVWDKVKHVMGHYNSVRHEFLLVCTRGSCQPDERKLFDSVVSIERTAHSVKPSEFYNIIEALYVTGRRLELFARARRPGWSCWGNEAPVDELALITPADMRCDAA